MQQSSAIKQQLRPITASVTKSFSENDNCSQLDGQVGFSTTDMNRNQEVGYFNSSNSFFINEDPLDINVRNLESLSLMDNMSSVNGLTGIENNENLVYFQDLDAVLNPYIDDPKEGNISRTVRVPSSEHVAEIVGRQGCKIKDLRARTNTYIKTPMRTQSPVFVVTGKEEAVLHVMEEIQNAAEHFTHIRASRNHHKALGGLDANKPASREGDIMIQVTVPYRVVGLVVGLKGQTIKGIQQDTDTFIVTPNRDKAPIFEIRGQPDNVERAKRMILRHIETRTRHCRLQDTTNLPANWNEDQKQNGNDFSFFNNESLLQNGNSSSNMSVNSNFSSKRSVPNGSTSNGHGPGFAFSSTSPPTNGNYNWRGYNNMIDQNSQQNGHITTWSNAVSDYPGMLGSGMSNGSNHMTNRSGNNFPYSMSLGSIPSSSNSSASISPPQDFLNDNPFSSHNLSNPFGSQLNSPHLRSLNDQDFSSFSLLSTASSTPTKGSLVLGNLFQSPSNVTSSLTNSLMSSNEGINGFQALMQDDHCSRHNFSSLGSFAGSLVESGLFSGHMNGFPSGNSSPTSKSCSLSDASGSHGSPIPRLCKICEEAEVVAALVPCGHNLFCMECAEGIVNKSTDTDRRCPVCKDTASDVLRIRA
ncbi:RNA-binding protein MEX3B [Biomphalaria glabrata]|uniref:RNA-binding protein MEX3B-like isoform X1 n=1 Tax=Biomphalaria glabrata TaxID=6526 RepID=A0A9U8EIE2_BIOGL|nr:RNA-binding protein MEX3B-like isoform X1 [Biomphalaria glabrata]KAI8755245.1 RNA-binding protein MEX3B-like [Biomphalaria glabrata]